MSDYKVKVKYCNEEAMKHPLVKIKKGDWIDLYTSVDVHMEAGEYKEIPLGVCIHLPERHEAIIAPRSSTFKKWGLICPNSIGIIDNAYHGDNDEWKFPAICFFQSVDIPKGTRIAQFRILRNMSDFKFETVARMDGRSRGGIGSTGD